MKLTLEYNGRTATREMVAVTDGSLLVRDMIAECERPTPGERMRQLYNDAHAVAPDNTLPWLEVSEVRREQWEEFARRAKSAAERGEL